MDYQISIIEDNHIYADLLKRHLERYHNFEIQLFYRGKDFLRVLDSEPQIICLDYGLPDISGMDLLRKIKTISPESHVIIVSSQPDLETVAQLIKNGAHDYVSKGPDARQKLSIVINNILKLEGLKKENRDLKEIISNRYDFKKLIKGSSKKINEVFDLMRKAAGSNFPVLVTGETGTGKELVAKGIHYNSVRKNRPFVPINISAIPHTLMESELFGHEKGAFTGASSRKTGKFELANGGTIFLDEIGDLDPALQSKLLRVIQENELVRVGGNKTVKLNIRLITATHRNLELLASEGKFRDDLFFRIRGLPINLPPLRERGNDILILARHFIQDYCSQNGLRQKTIAQSTLKKLLSYTFPGNIRELKSVIELACVLSTGDSIALKDLKFSEGINTKRYLDTQKTFKEYTYEIIEHHLLKYNNNIKTVSEILNLSRPTLYRLIKEMKDRKNTEKTIKQNI